MNNWGSVLHYRSHLLELVDGGKKTERSVASGVGVLLQVPVKANHRLKHSKGLNTNTNIGEFEMVYPKHCLP